MHRLYQWFPDTVPLGNDGGRLEPGSETIQPAKLNHIVNLVEAVNVYNLVAVCVEYRDNRVIVGLAPVYAENVFMPRLPFQLRCRRCRFVDVAGRSIGV